MATPTNAPKPVPVDASRLLELAMRLCEAHGGTAVSTRHLALAELVAAYRALPEGAMLILPAAAAPAGEIRREVGDGSYVLRAVAGAVTETTLDPHGDDTTSAYTPDQVRQKVRDLMSVLAAAEVVK